MLQPHLYLFKQSWLEFHLKYKSRKEAYLLSLVCEEVDLKVLEASQTKQMRYFHHPADLTAHCVVFETDSLKL